MDQITWLKGGWDWEQLLLIGTLAAILFGIFMVVVTAMKIVWFSIAWAASSFWHGIISFRQRSEMKRKQRRRQEFLSDISDYISDGIDNLLDEGKITKEEAQRMYRFYAMNMGLWDFIPRKVFASRPQIDVMDDIIERLTKENTPIPFPDAPKAYWVTSPLAALKPETIVRLRNRGFNIPENLLPKETKVEVKPKSDDLDLEAELRVIYAH